MNKLPNQNGIVVDEIMFEVYKINKECAIKAMALNNGCSAVFYPNNYLELPNINNQKENINEFCNIIDRVIIDDTTECYKQAKDFFKQK